jgi:hypothetical protein
MKVWVLYNQYNEVEAVFLNPRKLSEYTKKEYDFSEDQFIDFDTNGWIKIEGKGYLEMHSYEVADATEDD